LFDSRNDDGKPAFELEPKSQVSERIHPSPDNEDGRMKRNVENVTVRRVAVVWAASLAARYDAELIVVQVVVSQSPASTEHGAAEHTRAVAAAGELAIYTRQARPVARPAFALEGAAWYASGRESQLTVRWKIIGSSLG
jgi:hypothetical protein